MKALMAIVMVLTMAGVGCTQEQPWILYAWEPTEEEMAPRLKEISQYNILIAKKCGERPYTDAPPKASSDYITCSLAFLEEFSPTTNVPAAKPIKQFSTQKECLLAANGFLQTQRVHRDYENIYECKFNRKAFTK